MTAEASIGQLAARGAAHQTVDADQIADIEQPDDRQPDGIEQVAVAEDLDLARGVVEIDEHAAVADGADPSGDAHPFAGLGAGGERGMTPIERGCRHRCG